MIYTIVIFSKITGLLIYFITLEILFPDKKKGFI